MNKKPFGVKKRVQLSVAFVWIGALIALLSRNYEPWLLWVGMGIAILAAVYRYTMVRCPHCNYHLTDSRGVPDRCPNCGEKLD